MNDIEDILKTDKDNLLYNNKDYYRDIFKKTEKIVCAVLYVSHSNKDILVSESVVLNTIETAQNVLDIVLDTLGASPKEQPLLVRELSLALVELQSRLYVLHASQLLSSENLTVFIDHIDSVIRSLSHYGDVRVSLHPPGVKKFAGRGSSGVSVRGYSQDASAPSASRSSVQVGNRRERIIGVLNNKGQASIKDISDMVNDCSEKTIQRELIQLIKDNVVIKEGERRWSRYSLV